MIVPIGQNCMVAEVCRRWGCDAQIALSPISYALCSIDGAAQSLRDPDLFLNPSSYKRSSTTEGKPLPTIPSIRACFPHQTGDEWCRDDMAAVVGLMRSRVASLKNAMRRDRLTFTLTLTDGVSAEPLQDAIREIAGGRDWRLEVFDPLPTDYIWHQRTHYETPRGRRIERYFLARIGLVSAEPGFAV